MKKGFTLIELLAVLIILAIIALIAIPVVLNIISSAKEEANTRSAEMYIDAAEKAMALNTFKSKLRDATCEIQDGGNLDCNGSIIEVNLTNDDQVKQGGTVTIENRKITEIRSLTINDIVYDYINGKLKKLHKYIVSFDTNGGSEIASQEILEDRKVVAPEDPTKEDYAFKEWVLNGEEYDFNTPVTGNITLKARYFKDEDYTLVNGINFNSRIKTLANGKATTYGATDTVIISVKFFSNADLPEGYTDESLKELPSNSVGSVKDTVTAYYDGEGNIFVYSEGEILANETSSFMFNYLRSATDIDLSGLNVSNVKSMGSMFNYCTSLVNITLSSNFDSSKVENMQTMFNNCPCLESIDLIHLNTSNVTNMYEMFYRAGTATTELDFSNFDTRKVENMQGMFERTGMSKIDLSSFDFKSVTSTKLMFFESGGITQILFSPSEAPNLSDASGMFFRTRNLESLEFPIYNTSSLDNINSMFQDCGKIKTLDIRYIDFDTVTSYSNVFGVHSNAVIYIKDTQFNRDFMSTNFSTITPTYIAPPQEP